MAITSQSFKFSMKPEVVLSKANCGHTISDALDGAEAIVSPRDISRLKDQETPQDRFHQIAMPRTELVDLIRSIRDPSGKEVYSGAQIEVGEISQSMLYNFQDFADIDKIASLFKFAKFPSHFDFSGISKMEACILTYRNNDTKYVALYVPSVVEYMPKKNLERPLENLRRRARFEEFVELPASDGTTGRISLGYLVQRTEEILQNPNVHILPILRDGTHRAYLTNYAGTTLHAVMINGSVAMAPSVPIRTSEIVVTRGKPRERLDRFLGLDDSGWTDLKGVGIDG